MKIVPKLFFLSFFLLVSSAANSEPEIFDYLITDATIFDGEKFTSYRADVGITGSIISKIGDLKEEEALQWINGRGLVLTPGFIDAHTHSDFNPFIYPDIANKVKQGVTTEVTGNCGFSAAPFSGHHKEHMHDVWVREGVEIPESISWDSFAEYKEAVNARPLFHHHVSLVGHGNIRSAVMGMDPREASPTEMLKMRAMMRQAMNEGASGVSFGMVYLPGIFAPEEEIVEICREAAKSSGICAFHIRSEGDRLVEAVEEVIRVGKKAQARVQISHLKAGGGRKNWGKIDRVLELIEQARYDGLEVIADAYPYTAGFAELGVVLPNDLYTDPDRVSLFKEKRNDLNFLNRLREHYETNQMKWDWIRISSTPNKKYWDIEGKSIKSIALERNIEPEKFLIQILADTEFEVSAFYFSQSEEVMEKVISHRFVSVGSDSVADGSRRPHPRAYGTFPKILRKFARQDKTLKIGEAIHKMTSLPAKQFKLEKRGVIREGFYADVVLFDAGEITDGATYKKPTQENKAIEWVFVNGKPVIEDGKLSEHRPGLAL